MRRLIAVIALCLLTFPALCQSTSKWQVAIITEVKPHPAAGEDASDPITYDVSVKVGDTIYWCCTRHRRAKSPRSTQPGANCWCWSERTQLPTTTCWVGRFRCR